MAMLQGTRWLGVWMAPKEGQRTVPMKKLSSVAMATRASTFAWSEASSGASRGAAPVASHAAAASSFRSNRVGSGHFGFLSVAGAAWSTQQPSDLLPGLSSCASSLDDQIQTTESHPSLSDADASTNKPPLDAGDPSDDNNIYSFDDDVPLEDRSVAVTHEDVESEEAMQALYERWCKTFDKKRDDPVEKALRFNIFKDIAMKVFESNTYLPDDPEEAAIYLDKKRKVAAGEDVEDDDLYEDEYLGSGADGGKIKFIVYPSGAYAMDLWIQD